MSFIALLLYFFCTIIRPQDWMPGFIERPLVNILANTTIVLLLFERMVKREMRLAKVPQNLLMIGIFASILMSHVANTYFQGLTDAWNRFLGTFLLFFIIINALDSERKIKITVWVLAFLVLALVPQCVYQLQHGYGWAGQPLVYDAARDEKRVTWIGIFNDPNDLGLLFVTMCGLVLPFIFGKTAIVSRIISAGLLWSYFYGIFLTNSRGALIGIMVTIYFFFVRITRKFVLGGIIGGALAFGVLAIGPSRAKIINTTEASAYERFELWYQGILMMKSKPLFGVGFNMFTDQLAFTAHNSYVLAGAELGFFGLFFWMGLIYSSYKCLSFVQTNNPGMRNYAIGLQTALMGFCAAAFFLSRTYTILPYIFFAMAGAMAHITHVNNPSVKMAWTMKDWRNIFVLSVGILVVIYGFIKVGI